MNKRYICWLSSVIIISLGIWGLSERDRAKKLEIKVENNYNRAFHELVNYVDDIDINFDTDNDYSNIDYEYEFD